MKKVLLVIALLAATAAQAQWRHDHRYDRRWEPRTVIVERNDWMAPLIIGGIAGAVIANANQPPVIVQQPPVIVQTQPICTPWTEIQTSDGQIYRERTCNR